MIFSDYEDLFERFDHFKHAFIDDAKIGPRRALTLILKPLLWNGSQGYYGNMVTVRFGGIKSIDTLRHFCANLPEQEFAYIRLNLDKRRKKGKLHCDFMTERLEIGISFECQNISIG